MGNKGPEEKKWTPAEKEELFRRGDKTIEEARILRDDEKKSTLELIEKLKGDLEDDELPPEEKQRVGEEIEYLKKRLKD